MLDQYGIETVEWIRSWHFGRARALLPAGGGHLITFGSGAIGMSGNQLWNTGRLVPPLPLSLCFASAEILEKPMSCCGYVYGVMTPFATPTRKALRYVEEPKNTTKARFHRTVRKLVKSISARGQPVRLDPIWWALSEFFLNNMKSMSKTNAEGGAAARSSLDPRSSTPIGEMVVRRAHRTAAWTLRDLIDR